MVPTGLTPAQTSAAQLGQPTGLALLNNPAAGKQAPSYPQQLIRFGQAPQLPQGYADNLGNSAYRKKYEAAAAHAKTWRMRVCLGLMMVLFTVISISLGVSGIIMAAGVIDQDSDNDKEIQSARIILDALSSWNQPLPTSVKIVDSSVGCSAADSQKPLFASEWAGTEEGCYWEGKVVSRGYLDGRRTGSKNKQ